MRKLQPLAITALVGVLAASSLAASDPPAGSYLLPLLGAPIPAGSGPSATYIDAPWADRFNPAASGAQQRPVLDLGYGLLSDFGSQGVGTAINLGFDLPQPYGVWNGGLSFVSTPASMTDLPLGTLAQLRGGISKDLFPNLLVGAALDTTFGWNQGYGFGLGLNLGLIHKLGDLAFLKDFRYGAVLSNIGKGYSTAVSTWAMQAPFTLSGGARALLIRSDELKVGAGLDLSLPSFIYLGLGLSGSLVWRDILTLRLGWGFPSVRELAGGTKKNLLPSLALMGTFPLSGLAADSFMAQQGWDKSELRPALAVTPLYGNVIGISTGLTIPLGVVDQRGPDITAQFPTTAWGPWYLSPNADGNLDVLDIPVHIVDQRYVASYQMIISAKGSTDPVRTIANKESRPENEGFTGLWNRLLYVKQGLPIPEKLSWNGFGDGGERVPDGDYEVRISAIDDNGNRSEVGPFPVTVDTTPPQAELSVADGVMIFSPDGDGNKDTITIKILGSVEDLWTLKVLNAAGTAVRTSLYKNAEPSDFIWDGKSDSGTVVPDGVYSFSLASTDRAANPFAKRLENVVVNTQQPPVNIMIDASVFSPNADKVQDTLGLRPSVPVRSGLVSWKISVLDKARREVFSLGSSDPAAIPERYLFDGKGLDGKVLPEGSYQARLAATYQNGFSPVALSPSFVLDVTAPVATVRADRVAFNSAGNEGQNRVTFTQTGSEEELWTGEILAADATVSRSWNWNQKPAPVLAWDGSDDAGAAVPDGNYTYRLRSKDRAGNRFQSPEFPMALDTEKKTARLVTDLRAFSPNGDGIKDVLALGDTVQALDRVKGWKLGLYPVPEAGQHVDRTKVVKSWAGTNVISTGFSWAGTKNDGSKALDGRYVALLEVRWANDDAVEAQSLPILLDTVAPSVSVSAFPLDFAPNEDSLQKTSTITQKAVPGDNWEAHLVSASGNPVRTWSWKGQVENLVWDGSDDAGNTVVNGSYRYEVVSIDEAGNVGRAQIPAIRVDARKPQVSVTASAPGLSPNGDGVLDTITFALDHDQGVRDGISTWSLSILDASGADSLSVSGSRENIPETYVWNGLSASGTLVEGIYKARLTIMYTNGNHPVATSPGFILDVTAPVATVTADRSAFNPAGKEAQSHVTFTQTGSDEQGWTAEILASDGSVQRSWNWKGQPEASLAWDGTDDAGAPVSDGSYFYRLRSQDRAGNSYQSPVFPLALDTEKKTARLGTDLRAFSPNGDGIKDVLALTDTVPGTDRVKSWKLGIYPAPDAGQQADRSKAVRTWSGTTAILPAFTWIGDRNDGFKAAEGRYVAILEVGWANDDTAEAQTLPILLDTVAPALSASASPLLFSPNPESRQKTSKLVQKAVPGDDWEGRLLDSKGNAVRSWSW
ncbi:MAG: FlgD immunoglobulin-like domain containing protein, partial [Spirochaetota bacterium]